MNRPFQKRQVTVLRYIRLAVTTTVVLRRGATRVHLLGLVIQAGYDEARSACDKAYGNIKSYRSVRDDFSIKAVVTAVVEERLPT